MWPSTNLTAFGECRDFGVLSALHPCIGRQEGLILTVGASCDFSESSTSFDVSMSLDCSDFRCIQT